MDLYFVFLLLIVRYYVVNRFSILAIGTMVGRYSSRSGSASRRVTDQIDCRVRCYSRFDRYKVESKDMVDLD